MVLTWQFVISIMLLIIPNALAATDQASKADEQSMRLRYKQWMSKHGKSFTNTAAEQERFLIFKTNAEYVDKSNTEKKPYKLALNKWADITNEEYANIQSGYMPYNFSHRTNGLPMMKSTYSSVNLKAVPDTMDWRESGAVTPVQAQGECGGCWAFSAVAAVEGITKIKTGKITNLSEQQLVDCDTKYDQGCRGGHMTTAFDYIVQNGGVTSDSQYPYKGYTQGGGCNSQQAAQPQAKISGFSVVPSGDEQELLKAVSQQPVSVAVDSSCDAFRFYSSGILTNSCDRKVDHAITVVGYGTAGGMKFWLAKNSWGPNWGESGYIRIQRESGVPGGTCGIAKDCCYPVI